MDDLAAHQRRRALQQLTLNAAELIRHPAATDQERDDAERAVQLVRAGQLDPDDAARRVSDARARIRDRWQQAA